MYIYIYTYTYIHINVLVLILAAGLLEVVRDRCKGLVLILQ